MYMSALTLIYIYIYLYKGFWLKIGGHTVFLHIRSSPRRWSTRLTPKQLWQQSRRGAAASLLGIATPGGRDIELGKCSGL